jgi:hypothetical protein
MYIMYVLFNAHTDTTQYMRPTTTTCDNMDFLLYIIIIIIIIIIVNYSYYS